MLLKVVIV